LNTGSPHHVQLVDDLENYNIKENGAAIRYGDLYGRLEAMSILSKQIDENTFVAHL
jgi:diaminopimelate epimerase